MKNDNYAADEIVLPNLNNVNPAQALRALARRMDAGNARQKIWPLEGYLLKSRLAESAIRKTQELRPSPSPRDTELRGDGQE